jgi:hypothetical protein
VLCTGGLSWHGSDTLVIHENGDGAYLFHGGLFAPTDRDWYLAKFKLSDEALDGLKHFLIDHGYFYLKRRYYADNVADGTQWRVSVKYRGGKKVVDCNNHFPKQIVRLYRYLHVSIIAGNVTRRNSDRVGNPSVPFEKLVASESYYE